MRKEDIEKRTEALVLPIVDEFGFDLWDVEYVKEGSEYYLRAYIDKDGGITIDDCVDVSRKLSDRLDEDDFIDGEYILEVSSPGVERALKKDRDFDKSIGKDVYVKLYKAIDKQKEFVGKLISYDKTVVTVEIEGNNTEFTRSDIALIRLYVEF